MACHCCIQILVHDFQFSTGSTVDVRKGNDLNITYEIGCHGSALEAAHQRDGCTFVNR